MRARDHERTGSACPFSDSLLERFGAYLSRQYGRPVDRKEAECSLSALVELLEELATWDVVRRPSKARGRIAA